MDDLDLAWQESVRFFVDQKESASSLSPETIRVLKIGQNGRRALDRLQSHVDQLIRRQMVPQFCRALENHQNQQEALHLAVQVLHARFKDEIVPLSKRLQILKEMLEVDDWRRFGESQPIDLALLMLRATVFAQMSQKAADVVVYKFYERSLRCFAFREEQKRGDLVNADFGSDQRDFSQFLGTGESFENKEYECSAIINSFHETNNKLRELTLLHRMTPVLVMRLAKHTLSTRVQEMCQGNYTCGYLGLMRQWIESVLLGFMRHVYLSDNEAVEAWRKELHEHLILVYIRLRTNELFNVIIEFPESAPVLEDLKECLSKCEQRLMLSTHLRKTLEARILHIGVNTADILTAYIAAIKALRLLDPSGLVLSFACEPVRKYLRTRDDTVRCIVQGLIDDNTSELAEELQRNQGIKLEDSAFCSEDDEEEGEDAWQRWEPAPKEAGLPHKPQRNHSDIISMLVNIYGSKELFVNEYRTLLSTRLLSFNAGIDSTESEIRNLELLKRRFGESLLHSCEVMLKDITDSKRINSLLNENDDKENDEDTRSLENQENQENEATLNTKPVDLSKLPFPVSSTILSAQFWPDFKQETLQLPTVVADSLEAYKKAYEANKGNRTLIWKPHLGHAVIELEMDGWSEPLKLNVTPMQASIIYRFQERSRWSAEELASVLKIAVGTLRRRIAFWQSHGIIKEVDTDTYELSSSSESGSGAISAAIAPMSHDEDELTSATSSRHEQRHAEFQLFWTFIVSMLTNLEGELSLDQIYQKLKCFAFAQTSSAAPMASSGGMAGRTAEERDRAELAAFLDSKVRQRELTFAAGVYKLPK